MSFLLEDLNTMNFVFLVLSDNLLTFNHSATLMATPSILTIVRFYWLLD